MRLLRWNDAGEVSFTQDFVGDDTIPPYAILSHTWEEGQEVTYKDVIDGAGKEKSGYKKIEFCGEQARKDNLEYFGSTPVALYSPPTGDNALRKGRYLPPKTTEVVTRL